MAETKPTATATAAKATTSVQPKKSGNLISILAPILCVLGGYVIWRFLWVRTQDFHSLTWLADFGPTIKDQRRVQQNL